MACVASMPVLTASAPMSSSTASICCATSSAATAWTVCTPRVFCAVMAVMTLAPYTSKAANALRSAWMPAPPPESEPAMVSALAAGGKRAGVHLADPLTGQDAQEAAVAIHAHGVGLVLGQQLLDLVQRIAGVGAQPLLGHRRADWRPRPMFTHQSVQLVDVQHAQQLAIAHHREVRLVVEDGQLSN